MTINVKETKDGFEISWDPDDPVESVFNDWTEDDFRAAIFLQVEKVLAGHTFEEGFLEK